MPSERIQRSIDALLDEADESYFGHQGDLAEDRAGTALGLDPDNLDALAILSAIERMTGGDTPHLKMRP